MSLPDRPLHILHLTAGSDAGGLSRYIFNLSSAMHAQGHKITVAGERGAWHWLFEKAPWPWIDVPLKGGPFALRRAAATLRNYVAEHPVDVFHAHYRRATLTARRLQKTFDVPLLYTVHLSHLSLRGMHRWLSDFGDYTHAASRETRQWLIEAAHVAPDRIALIPHGIDSRQFHPPTPEEREAARAALHLQTDDRAAIYVGRLDDPKNVDWLLDFAAASRVQLPMLKLLLVGEGPQQAQLERRIQRENLQSRVVLLGHRDPAPLYHASDAFLLASWREGFSLASAEAMASGVPVFRTRTSGCAELIQEGITGRSVPIDHDAFVEGAIRFLSDPPALKEMARAAVQHVQRNYAFERQVEEMLKLYQNISARG